ncbi:aldehyde-activating protein [Actibacterium mucosum KCTC 23349]|uniref:Aldehyde-activating protein n=1 Tax=Actibacterium mucosum KCTC 23349 TaxID=1454373 RepID=A0A037ZFZ3_9RHOB|nr:GFA family protein [Actibacterium mucosum]KAJ54426.1 aldehyde-activating protein [Actibacterium mucosum KCTC 23349]
MTQTCLNTGGCQCGAVRYRFARLGRASICHCRMCQKAFGGFFGPLVTAHGLEWTRGQPARFDSSNRNWRGFCGNCGTPLTYAYEGGVELSIGSLDTPEMAAPAVQVNTESKCSFFDNLPALPVKTDDEAARDLEWNAGVRSNQHPDHDT